MESNVNDETKMRAEDAMSGEATNGFWAIVELLGHRRMAGYISEVLFGGQKLVRVALGPWVVDLGDPHGQMFGGGAIYAINPCSEAAARLARDDVGETVAEYYDRLTARPALPPAERDEIERVHRVEDESGDVHTIRYPAPVEDADVDEPCATCERMMRERDGYRSTLLAAEAEVTRWRETTACSGTGEVSP
jgi:hypothetical protein